MSTDYLNKILRKIDLFSTPITFRIENSYEYHSLIGGLFTLLFILFSLFYFFYMGYFFIIRDNVSFIYSRRIIDTEPYINLTKVEFKFAFGLQYADADEDVLIELGKYFDFSFRFVEWIGERNITYIPFNYKRCEKSDFLNKVDEQFEINRIEDLFCPDDSSIDNYTINGAYVDDYFRYIEVKVLLSEYSLNNFKEFQNIMLNTRLEMVLFFLDKAIDYENRTLPLPYHFGFSYKGLDPNFKKETNIYLSCIELYNDENWFFEKPKIQNEAMYDQSVDTFIYLSNREDNNANLGIYNIEASSNVFVLNRKYEKLPTFFAKVTGILSAINLICNIINEYINRIYINEYIIHKTMKYRGNKNINVEDILFKLNKFGIEKKKIFHQKMNSDVEINFNFDTITTDSKNSTLNKNSKDNSNEKSIPIPVKKDKNLPELLINEKKKYHKSENINGTKLTEEQKIIYRNEHIRLSKTTLIQKDFSKMNIMKILSSFCCFCFCKKQKLRNYFFKQVSKKINCYLDIKSFVERVFEHELILQLLFNWDEYCIFKFLSKPNVKVRNSDILIFQNSFNSEFCLNQNNDNNIINNLIQSYNSITLKEKKSKLSKQLLEFMEEQIDFLS